MRACGVLLPIFSLPGAYGIGGFSREAFDFIDFLKKSGQSYWQILPLGPTGYGDSPYQAFSTFAGNPYFISLDALYEEGLLTKNELKRAERGQNAESIDYGELYESRWPLLRKAFKRFEADEAFERFCAENAFWLNDYAAYRVLKDLHGGRSWQEWEEKYKRRHKSAMAALIKKHDDEICFYKFLEYVFFTQWSRLKEYANDNGIKIIGDLPIYVSGDSSDAWSNPELFEYDRELKPVNVAGCPPDAFSEEGQLWGNPVYKWSRHEKSGYKWWIDRLEHCFRLYDVLRLDHFRGFVGYYSIPFGMKNAKIGKWEEGPGTAFFSAVKEALGEVPIIAEDLGFLTEDVVRLMKETGYPGMKILEFAFDASRDSIYLPYNYDKNCVVYTGTHDNETLPGWLSAQSEEQKAFLRDYLDKPYANDNELTWSIIRLAYSSCADLCVIPIQDFLCLGSEARINEPSTLGKNWKWRMQSNAMSEELAHSIKNLAVTYGRDNLPSQVQSREA